jgi:hypothetical protein
LIDIGLVFFWTWILQKLTGRFSDTGLIEFINQLLIQNYHWRQCRTREQLTDFNSMDFTENDYDLSEHYEKLSRKSSSLAFKTSF